MFSRIASLVLNSKEVNALSSHYKHTISRFQKLPLNCPESVVFFITGMLPATAICHLRTLGLFAMIIRSEPSSILQQIGRKIFLSAPSNKKSWFVQLRSITNLYLLPNPLLPLQLPMSKIKWKKQCKATVISYWEEKLPSDAATLSF